MGALPQSRWSFMMAIQHSTSRKRFQERSNLFGSICLTWCRMVILYSAQSHTTWAPSNPLNDNDEDQSRNWLSGTKTQSPSALFGQPRISSLDSVRYIKVNDHCYKNEIAPSKNVDRESLPPECYLPQKIPQQLIKLESLYIYRDNL